MKGPICCKKPMELKAAYKNGTVQTNRPAGTFYRITLFFQCKKCGIIYWEDSRC